MITNRKCISAEAEVQEQGFLSNHTWVVIRKVWLLKGVLWDIWDALVPPMCLNCPSSYREQCQDHPAPVWLATPPSGTGPGRLWGTSQEEACRQRGMHNSWIFAARWASIMHCIKIQMLEQEAGNSKKQHGQSKCQRNENMSKTVTEHSATFHITSSIISHRRFQILGKRLQKYSKIQYLYFEC